tara:strand:+ start:500 stop:649 length:150 start_codon:yes stop_codon:yes gene_type:complete
MPRVAVGRLDWHGSKHPVGFCGKSRLWRDVRISRMAAALRDLSEPFVMK